MELDRRWINKAQLPTCNIAKKSFIGMRSSSPASISLYFDNDVLRNPFHAILPNVGNNNMTQTTR